MEVLGGAASVIAVVQIAGKVWSLCWKYLSDAKDAKSDIERLMSNITAVQCVFQQVQELAKSPGAPKLLASKTLIEKIPSELQQEFERLLKVLDPGKRKATMKALGLRSLKWPLQKEEVERTFQLLERHKTTLLTAMSCDQL